MQVVACYECEPVEILIRSGELGIRLLEICISMRKPVNHGTELDIPPLKLNHAFRLLHVDSEKAQFTFRRTVRATNMRGQPAQQFAVGLKQRHNLHDLEFVCVKDECELFETWVRGLNFQNFPITGIKTVGGC